MGRAGAARATASPSLTLARSCVHREETSSRLGLLRPPRPGAAGSARGRPAHPSMGGAPARRGRGHVPPGPPGASARRKPEHGRGAGASRAISRVSGARGGRTGRCRPQAVADTTSVPSTCGRPCQELGVPPGAPNPGQTCYSRFLPLRSGEEWVRRGRAAAPRSPPEPRTDDPRGGGAGACPGMVGRLASAYRPARQKRATGGKAPLACVPRSGQTQAGRPGRLARPSGLTPGDLVLRRATAFLAQAAGPQVV